MTCSVAGIIKYSVDDMIISVCQCVVSVGFGSTLLLHLKTQWMVLEIVVYYYYYYSMTGTDFALCLNI